MLEILLTLAVGAVGAALLFRLKLPAGALIGALTATAILVAVSGYGTFPGEFKTVVQIVAGAFIGQRITKRDIGELRQIVGPAIKLLFGVIVLTCISGAIIALLSGSDIRTGMLSAMPGGVSDVAIISVEMGADASITTVLQLVRFLTAILIMPQINAQICKRYSGDNCSNSRQIHNRGKEHMNISNFLLTAVIAGSAGIIGKLTGIPGGSLLFAMVAVAAFNVKTERAFIPKPLRYIAQTVSGVLVGLSISFTWSSLQALALPALFVVLNAFMINYIIGFWIYKTSKLDLATSLFASNPAGVSDMALISLDLGGDAPKVTVLQLVRYISVMALVPSLSQLLYTVFS